MKSHLSSMTPARAASGPRARARRRRGVAGVVLTSAALVLSACAGDPVKDPQDTASATTLSRLSPLTGEVLPEQPGHPVLAVKVDNSGSAKQVGMGKADMVVEELVEGGITRLAVFYYSRIPSDVGPVRSLRSTDIGIVAPLKAVVVASGGAPPTWKRVREAGLKTFSEGGRGFYRGAGSAPYNLFVDMDKLVGPLEPPAKVPEPYLPFGDAGLPKGKPAKRFTAVFSQASDSTFEHRRGRYVNTDGYARGEDFLADTVLVLRVKVGLAGYRDPSGYPVPETKFTGRGQASVFHGGRVVEGTWVKDGLKAPLTLRAGGKALELPPGQVRIALVPQDAGSLRVG
jgi:hypothetical protein